jgi:hypothetical protein
MLWHSDRIQKSFKPKEGEQNESQTYQLILNSMQILTVANISKIVLLDSKITDNGSPSKTKQKVPPDPTTEPFPTKRVAIRSSHATKANDTMDIA